MHPKMFKKMDDVSEKWQKYFELEKLLEMHFQQRKWAKWMNYSCSSKKKANDNARDSMFFLGVKSGPSTVSLFCVCHKHLELRDFNSNYFSNSRHCLLDIYKN